MSTRKPTPGPDDSPDWAVKIIKHVQALGAAVAAISKVEGGAK